MNKTDPRRTTSFPRPTRVQCVVGETLRDVVVLTESEWDAIPADRRPSPAEHFDGLGWVVAGRIPQVD